jgi:DNA-binding beta-propeller fold protein YncE
MKLQRYRFLIAFATVMFLGLGALAAGPGYRLVQTYKLGGEGGWDYLTFDDGARLLYISRGTHTMVVNADSGTAAGDVADTPGVHGIALAHEFGRGFTSNGRENMVSIFDLKTFKTITKVKVGERPDAIVYDPASKRVFTFNAGTTDTTAVDAEKGTVAGSIKLDGKPEFAAADGKGTVFVNIEDKSEIEALDSQKLTVTAKWPLAPCEEPSGLAMDRAHRRLFAGCGNKQMAVVNADTGKVITTLPIGDGVDANAFDDGAQLAFASCGEGVLTVVHEDSPDKYSVVENAATKRGARTMALDPKTHQVFLVTADFGPRPTPTADNPRPRPPMLPDSFVLLVMGK